MKYWTWVQNIAAKYWSPLKYWTRVQDIMAVIYWAPLLFSIPIWEGVQNIYLWPQYIDPPSYFPFLLERGFKIGGFNILCHNILNPLSNMGIENVRGVQYFVAIYFEFPLKWELKIEGGFNILEAIIFWTPSPLAVKIRRGFNILNPLSNSQRKSERGSIFRSHILNPLFNSKIKSEGGSIIRSHNILNPFSNINENQRGVRYFSAIIFWTLGSVFYGGGGGVNISQQNIEPGFKISHILNQGSIFRGIKIHVLHDTGVTGTSITMH